MDNFIIIDEDLYRQIEILPEENYFYINQFIEAMNSERNNITPITISRENFNNLLTPLIKYQIKLEELKSIFDDIGYNSFSKIQIGYGKSNRKMEKTIAWGFERFGIFVEYTDDFMVSNIWISSSGITFNNNSGYRFYNALMSLGSFYKLILIDWNLEVLVKLTNIENVRAYLINSFDFTLDKS